MNFHTRCPSNRNSARLLRTALLTEVLAVLHFVDHVIRGQLVLDRSLDPLWNHRGWPFQPAVSPFTGSLVVHVLRWAAFS